MFGYERSHCHEPGAYVQDWNSQAAGDIDFRHLSTMLYEGAFYAVRELLLRKEVHCPLIFASL